MSNTNTIMLGDIGQDGMTKEAFRELLAKADRSEELVLIVDSDGGSVFDGFAMYDDLAAYDGPTRAVIQSAAFSIAAFIPMACDEIEITPNGYLMIHNPMVDTFAGDDAEHASRADLLAKLKRNYAEAIANRTGKSVEQVQEWMRAETYFSAADAAELGLVDRILKVKRPSALAVVASGKCKKLPHSVYASLRSGGEQVDTSDAEELSNMADTKPTAATIQEIKAACPKANADFVLRCAERALPIAQVTAEYTEEQAKAMEELQAELEETKAELKAMKDEAEAKALEEDQAKAMEKEEDTEAKAKASRPGVAPVARVASTTGKQVTATQRWQAEIAKRVESGQPKHLAAQAVNRAFPGLRSEYLAEVN